MLSVGASNGTFSWESADLRPSQAYEIVPHDALDTRERRALGAMAEDPDHFGILRARDPSLHPPQAISNDVALLWLSLSRCGSAPRRLLRSIGSAALERLVLDEVLEVAVGGAVLRGASAARVLSRRDDTAARGRVAELSRAALEYAEALKLDDVDELAPRLYRYNTQPLSPSRAREIGDGDALARWLGLDRPSVARDVARKFQPLESKPDSGWRRWSARGVKTKSFADRTTYKLYVSPILADLGEVFASTVAALAACEPLQMKVGRRLIGVLRADKLVVYFPTFEALADAAARIAGELVGARPQGVPFTAEISLGGLLSWGIDPPLEIASGDLGGSYRVWLVNSLARSLTHAKRAGVPDAVEYALARLRADGVDTSRWCPSQSVHERVAENFR